MKLLANMHPVSVLVIFVILTLFAISVAMLFVLCRTYRRHAKLAVTGDTYRSRVLHDALEDFTTAYKTFGPDTNTPAIVSSAITNNLHPYLMFERFLNNAVSLFVTMGLLGTFLGLSLSVASLSQLLGSTADWQNELNNMGSGLLSALSGMGVAFYTSLFGVGCSIILTILRTIFNPEAIRQELENEMELWLDHRTAAHHRPGSGRHRAGQADDRRHEHRRQRHGHLPEGYHRCPAESHGGLHRHGEFLQQGRAGLLRV